MKVHTIIELFQGVITDVYTFKNEKAAEAKHMISIRDIVGDEEGYPKTGSWKEVSKFYNECIIENEYKHEVRYYTTNLE